MRMAESPGQMSEDSILRVGLSTLETSQPTLFGAPKRRRLHSRAKSCQIAKAPPVILNQIKLNQGESSHAPPPLIRFWIFPSSARRGEAKAVRPSSRSFLVPFGGIWSQIFPLSRGLFRVGRFSSSLDSRPLLSSFLRNFASKSPRVLWFFGDFWGFLRHLFFAILEFGSSPFHVLRISQLSTINYQLRFHVMAVSGLVL